MEIQLKKFRVMRAGKVLIFINARSFTQSNGSSKGNGSGWGTGLVT
jgi:hypothetical protein